jgi:hypothetical protein
MLTWGTVVGGMYSTATIPTLQLHLRVIALTEQMSVEYLFMDNLRTTMYFNLLLRYIMTIFNCTCYIGFNDMRRLLQILNTH